MRRMEIYVYTGRALLWENLAHMCSLNFVPSNVTMCYVGFFYSSLIFRCTILYRSWILLGIASMFYLVAAFAFVAIIIEIMIWRMGANIGEHFVANHKCGMLLCV